MIPGQEKKFTGRANSEQAAAMFESQVMSILDIV
jgi:hypothetical protein